MSDVALHVANQGSKIRAISTNTINSKKNMVEAQKEIKEIHEDAVNN